MTSFLDEAGKTFYPRLLLYATLAGYKSTSEPRQPSSDDSSEIRRKFLDSFAYLCDYKKGGATVTAAALQKLPCGNILWLAANEGIDIVTKNYAKHLLRLIQNVQEGTKNATIDVVIRSVVDGCAPRLSFYGDKAKRSATICRMKLRRELPNSTAIEIRKKLKKLSEPPAGFDMTSMVNLCYDMRGSEVDYIKSKSLREDDDFGTLAHYIGRLGATRASVISAVRGMIHIQALRQIRDIRVLDEGPGVQNVNLDPTDMVPYEIVWSISHDSNSRIQDVHEVLHNFVELDSPLHDDTGNSLRGRRFQSWSRKPIETRVHAELQLADRFSRDNLEFVGRDKYVGCSKPACYFCYNWLSTHQKRFVPPATHHKIIPHCRAPDDNLNDNGRAILRDMYEKMSRRVGQDIVLHLLQNGGESEDQTGRQRYRYLSTEGSSLAPSRI
ncbi:hypothetical protein F5Y15DRAFT_287442 [Xylariaceae sp. FL0016]|nr:hypothetical protein F5Y15DRAFT_287442 [Xylariaceae sp. FL0016]